MARSGRPSNEVQALVERKNALSKQLLSHLEYMPLLSIPWPRGWEYRSIGMVTAQTVTGTGIFADMTSLVTDFLGTQSGVFRDKLRKGENRCKNGLRMDALKLGGSAVIGVDVDYAEVGNMKMLMVCMTGTAVRLDNIDELNPVVASNLAKARDLLAEIANIRM